jgi:hypothetical protein
MSEIITREILGIAQKSKWNSLKQFLKKLIDETLNIETGYILIAFDALIGGKTHPEFDYHIKKKENIKRINQIKDFSQLSLYQYTDNVSNHVDITKQDGVLIMIAKYMGPNLNQKENFDFSVHLDALNPPYFTDGNKSKLSCSEILKLINSNSKKKEEVTISSKSKKKEAKIAQKEDKIATEILVFEKLKNKNAIWAGKETNAFKNWKMRTANKYRKESGKTAYYKGNPTKNYSKYLENLASKNKKSRKSTKIKRKSVQSPKNKNNKKLEPCSEEIAFEKITGKNAYWAGKKTKGFIVWKEKLTKKYRKKTGKNPYYRDNLTKNFKTYLENLISSIAN